MKRASYRHAVQWIAANDEPSELDVVGVAGYVSTLLIADIFGTDPERVARDIVRERQRWENERAKAEAYPDPRIG